MRVLRTRDERRNPRIFFNFVQESEKNEIRYGVSTCWVKPTQGFGESLSRRLECFRMHACGLALPFTYPAPFVFEISGSTCAEDSPKFIADSDHALVPMLVVDIPPDPAGL